MSDSPAIGIENITVKNDRIICEVRVVRQELRYTNPRLIENLIERFPKLPSHTCKNAEGSTFAAVMDHTSTPHLLEHLVIDLQVQNSLRDDTPFIGTTEWLDEGEGLARIEVSFADDLGALRAFRDATQILNLCMI